MTARVPPTPFYRARRRNEQGAGRPGAGRVERLLLAGALLALVLLAVWRGWLWRLDLVLYDAQMPLWRAPPPQDVVIVAIDEQSLEQLGRWPWPRRVHAELLQRLREAGVRAVALDVIFAEPDRTDPQGDRLLADELAAFRGAVLPVLVEQSSPGGPLTERLPMPALAVAADALGHVHVELDADGIVRSQFLREGLGEPRWPSLALALFEQFSDTPIDSLPGERRPLAAASGQAAGRGRWVRDYRVLVPFTGPPGHFSRLSYSQVLSGEFLPGSLRGSIVLVGVTAAGLGDAVPTPVSGYERPMPGVEFNANVLQALRSGSALAPLERGWQLLLSGLLTLLPLLVYPRLRPRQALLAALAGVAAAPLLSVVLLLLAHVWFAPAVAMLGVVLGYPLWSWRRLEGAVRYLERELALVEHETASRAERVATPSSERALAFVSEVIGASGWRVLAGGTTLATGGNPPPPPVVVPGSAWQPDGPALWRRVGTTSGERWLGIGWPPACDEAAARALLERLPGLLGREPVTLGDDAVELLEGHIGALQRAAAELRAARALLDDGLADMQDGVLLADAGGAVMLVNPAAVRRLRLAGEAVVTESLLEVMSRLTPLEGAQWREGFADVLLAGERWQRAARDADERELLVSAAPLSDAGGELVGVVVTMTDVSALRESERRRAELLAFLSHDLRAPLHSVLALVELAREGDSAEERARTLRRIESSTRGTLSLADQFLDLTRAESGAIHAHAEIDLVGVVLDACDQVHAQAEARRIRLETDLGCDDALLHGDSRLIERAVVNLLGNAIKWSDEGASVELALTAVAGGLRISVRDHGPGIAAEALPRLFQRFSRVNAMDGVERPGTGLGLALVKAVAEAHGGRVAVHSTPGAGSCFEIWLPQRASPGAASR